MTVKELIEKLGTFDSDLPVIVDGYEGGYNLADSGSVRCVTIRPTPVGRKFWEGEFDDFRPDQEGASSALLISRYPSED